MNVDKKSIRGLCQLTLSLHEQHCVYQLIYKTPSKCHIRTDDKIYYLAELALPLMAFQKVFLCRNTPLIAVLGNHVYDYWKVL